MTLPQLALIMVRNLFTNRWVVRQLRSAPGSGDSILAAIRRSIDSGTLGEAEGGAIIHTLLSAGGESTSSLLGNAVRILAESYNFV